MFISIVLEKIKEVSLKFSQESEIALQISRSES